MQLVLDGAAYCRTKKCALVARYPLVLSSLQVCWEGVDRAHNCEVCEKCIRTKMNLMAVGIDAPPCFSSPLAMDDIGTLRAKNAVQLGELKSILSYADQHGVRAEWVNRLAAVIQREERAQGAKATGGIVGRLRRLAGGW
jgi:hypothetical protein